MHVDSFTNVSLANLKPSLRHENGVLYALKRNPRVSTWDMSEHPWLQNIIAKLEEKQLILPVNEEYPWHKWKITEAGNRATTV